MGNGTRETAEEQGRMHDKSMDSYVDSKLGWFLFTGAQGYSAGGTVHLE